MWRLCSLTQGRDAQQVRAPGLVLVPLFRGTFLPDPHARCRNPEGLTRSRKLLTVENHVILYNTHWRIFKRRLDNLIREGIARPIPPPVGGDGQAY